MRFSPLLASVALLSLAPFQAEAAQGYLRDPAISGETVVFDAEQSVWRVPLSGGSASRLTAPIGIDPHPVLSPDGKQIAFLADYDGPTEIYVMSIEGGTPRRITFENQDVIPIGWDKKAGILYSTAPAVGPSQSRVVVAIYPVSGTRHVYPLADANDAALSADGQWIYFVRFGAAVNRDHLRLYRGGAMAQLWRYRLKGGVEAQRIGPQDVNLRRPMLWNDRLIIVSDKDGRDNLWSYALDGTDGHQLTHHRDFGVRQASLSDNHVVYQLGADLHHLDLQGAQDGLMPIDVVSDHAARRPLWLDNPFPYLTEVTLAPSGRSVALTLRGHVVLATPGPLRQIMLASNATTRLRHATISPDGKTLYAFSDKGGESELWAFPTTGSAEGTQLTRGSKSEPMGLWISPDGSHIAHTDLVGRLFLYDVGTRVDTMIDDARLEGRTEYASLTWAPNGRTLAFVRARSESIRRQIALYTLDTGKTVWVTTPDYESFAPCFSPDGSFLWFLSDRVFNLKNGGPWGDRNTAPVYGPRTGVFALSLRKDTHFPFAPPTELDQPSLTRISPKTTTQPQNRSAIDLTDLGSRLYQLPIPAAEIRKIEVGSDTLYLLTHKAEQPASKDDDLVLKAVKIAPGDVKLTDFATGLHDVALTPDAKTLMLLAGNGEQPPKIQLVPAATDMAGVNASDTTIRLNGLRLRIDPGAEWVGMFNDAWRLHRDHFYDPALHGVDWSAAREQYRPLLSRIGDRSDLDDLLGQMVGDLNALHSRLQPAETSTRDNKTLIASLGAHLTRQPGGFLIDRLYEGDPDLPKDRSPLVAPGLDVQPGDLITALNGQTLADLPDLSTLLANQADKQVLLTLKRKDRVFQVVVTPIDARQDATLRLRAWEEERAQRVATASHGRIGYLHLRAMGSGDMERFTRDFFSQTEKDGLIIDVRRNFGGNIDSWVLSELLHKVWMFWSDHGSAPIGNMQQTFRGHLAILCDELTYSDGETFSQGVKALGIGPLIGTRTSGAGVWLNDDDLLVDNGMPRTAGRLFFDLKGQWLVENHGVDPVIPVENLPVATFKGEDAQLDKALEILSTRLRTHPIPALVPRPFDETNQAISPD